MLLEHRESRSAPKKVLKARVCDVCFNIERRQERAAASLRAAEDAAEVGGASAARPDQMAVKHGLPLYLAQLAHEAGVAHVDRLTALSRCPPSTETFAPSNFRLFLPECTARCGAGLAYPWAIVSAQLANPLLCPIFEERPRA